ncbi:MAG TPA: arginase family protein [Candidatus Sulfotelmatobacter sp.]|nr:arginase family protein [Candidatus Sulfotelmatobacter sp.]
MSYRILHVATNLGLRPGGVERLGDVLLEMDLADRIKAAVDPPIKAPAFNDSIDPAIGARNVQAVAQLAIEQADEVEAVLADGDFPIVLGGDDSVLFGNLLALRRKGSVGVYLLDAHTDFWDPHNSEAGELSESDIWIATGRGVPQIGNLEGRSPLVKDQACVLYGHRDRDLQLKHKSDDVYTTPMLVRNLGEVRAAGISDAANHAIAFLRASGVDRAWLHLDADCLSDELMPAVDWRVRGGFTAEEVVGLAKPLINSGLVAGMDVTIYNPSLDTPEHAAGKNLADVVVSILT